jgi:hypothetical protein
MRIKTNYLFFYRRTSNYLINCKIEFIFAKLNLEALCEAIKGICLDVHAENTNRIQNAGEDLNV